MKKIYLIGVLVSTALTACGGGDSSTITSNPVPPNSQPVVYQPITSVPAPTYSDLERQSAFARINELRRLVGIGLLAQNELIDQAALNHANYMISGFSDGGHFENPGVPSFTGVNSVDRMRAVGYAVASGTEILISAEKKSTGTQIVDGFVATAYHRLPIFDYNWTNVGMGWKVATPLSPVRPFVIDFAYSTSGRQGAPATPYVQWPQPGAVISQVEMPLEIPAPSPNQPGGYGYPVSLQLDGSKVLKVQRFELKEAGTVSVPVYLLSYDTDPNLVALNYRHYAALVPKSPLKHLTSYTVTFEGTVDGQPLNLNWGFSTP